MNTAIINFTTNPQLKTQAQQVATELGIPLSLALNYFLKDFIRTKKAFPEGNPTKRLIAGLKQSDREIKEGKVISFKDIDGMIAYVDKMIENEKRLKFQ